MSLVKLLETKSIGDDRGYLTVLEGSQIIPFDIKRVYYLTGTQEHIPRGFHAHKQLEQVAVCVAGQCKILLDNAKEKEWVLLDTPFKVVRIEKMVWHEMHEFSSDCVLLVLASDKYDESDYIRNYQQFLEAK